MLVLCLEPLGYLIMANTLATVQVPLVAKIVLNCLFKKRDKKRFSEPLVWIIYSDCCLALSCYACFAIYLQTSVVCMFWASYNIKLLPLIMDIKLIKVGNRLNNDGWHLKVNKLSVPIIWYSWVFYIPNLWSMS